MSFLSRGYLYEPATSSAVDYKTAKLIDKTEARGCIVARPGSGKNSAMAVYATNIGLMKTKWFVHFCTSLPHGHFRRLKAHYPPSLCLSCT